LLNVTASKFAFNTITDEIIIDATSDGTNLYGLISEQFFVNDLTTGITKFYGLTNVGIRPTRLNLSSHYLFIGFANGTVEIRELQGDFTSIKITADDDMGGPGIRDVINSSLSKYFFVNTREAGLLVYSHPTFLNTKWIMIGLETSITSYSYHSEFLYVLTSENEVHVLDFANSKLLEIPVRSYPYFDLFFDGKFLYMIYKQGVHVYESANKHRLKSYIKSKIDPGSIFIVAQRQSHDSIFILTKKRIMDLASDLSTESPLQIVATIENEIGAKSIHSFNISYINAQDDAAFVAHLTLLTASEIVKYSISV